MSRESIQQAYDAAYNKYALSLTKYAYSTLYNMGFRVDVWDMAQDITHEAFLDTFASRNISNLVANENHLRNSLYMTTKNKAIDLIRRAKKVSSYDQPLNTNDENQRSYEFGNQVDPIEATLSPIYNDQLRGWIYQQLLKIHKGNREKADYVLAILDYRIDGVTWDQIAHQLGKNLSTVKKDWERSRVPLLVKLKDEGIL